MARAADNNNLSAGELARAALIAVRELTGYRPETTTGLDWDGDDDLWRVTVEVLELARVPNTTDVIGSYEVRLDAQGNLRGFRRVRRFPRGEVRED